MPISFAREAWPFVLPLWLLAAALALWGHLTWAAVAAAVGLLVLLFFRDPRRRYEGDEGIVLAAADGRVLAVDEVEDPAVGEGTLRRVVTFLSVFDVHVQRAPVAGEVVLSRLSRGAKVAAFRPDADRVNEKHLTVLRRPGGELVGIYQIAGLVARRVVCYLEAGQRVERGRPMGLIKFGSRVDVLVPASYRVLVRPGDRLRNGATPIAAPPEAP